MAANGDLLAEVPLFQFLDAHERNDLAGRIEEIEFAEGSEIFAAGDPGDAMYVISTGIVEIYFKDNTGHEIVLETNDKGDFFGEISLLDQGSRTASARAVSDVVALRVAPKDLEGLVRAHPQSALDLLSAMGRRARVTAELLRHTASRNVNQEAEDVRSPLDRAADWVSAASGSIPFLAIHIFLFAAWIGWNVAAPDASRFDPFPFGLLTMAVSLEAIILSVFVLLSQNRQIEKERVRSDIEYDVNLKAELEIMQLHEKVDRFASDVLGRLASIERNVGGGKG